MEIFEALSSFAHQTALLGSNINSEQISAKSKGLRSRSISNWAKIEWYLNWREHWFESNLQKQKKTSRLFLWFHNTTLLALSTFVSFTVVSSVTAWQYQTRHKRAFDTFIFGHQTVYMLTFHITNQYKGLRFLCKGDWNGTHIRSRGVVIAAM